MDLNASPEPEDEEVFPEQLLKEDYTQEEHVGYNEHMENGETAVQLLRREREERILRLRRQHPGDRPSYGSQPYQRDDKYQVKKQRPNNELPPGWLDCPAVGQEICGLIPSKVPLGEFFNEFVLPGKRYSSRQVVHQQRVLGRKGWDDPYVTRTHEGLLKWKYPEMNSVDFLFKVAEDRHSLFLFE